GNPLTAPLRIGGGVERPCWSRDGRKVAVANGLVVQVWDAQTGELLTPPIKPHVVLLNIAFSPDQKGLLAVTADRRILRWDLTAPDWSQEVFDAAARLFTWRQLDVTGAVVPLNQALQTADSGTVSPPRGR